MGNKASMVTSSTNDRAVNLKQLVEILILISSLPDEYNHLMTALETIAEDKLTFNYVRAGDFLVKPSSSNQFIHFIHLFS